MHHFVGLLRLSGDRIAQVFGWRVHKRLRGRLSSMQERTEHGHHVLRAYAKSAVMRMYEKFSTFLRLEALSNNLYDFGLNRGVDNLDQIVRPSPQSLTASPHSRLGRWTFTLIFLSSCAALP